jgi:hypothetical protein
VSGTDTPWPKSNFADAATLAGARLPTFFLGFSLRQAT